jgi:multidrug efflux pump subunit AcrA (membrane-fusion protein)
MWMNLPGGVKTGRALAAALLCLCASLLAAVPVKAQEAPASQAAAPQAAADKITLAGKVYCSLKHIIPLPFAGVVNDVPVKIGQTVKAGEVLARYRLTPEAALALRRRSAPPHLQELAAKLAEVEGNLVQLEARLQSSEKLAQQQLASEKALSQIKAQHRYLLEQRRVLAESLKQERRLAGEEAAVIREQLGTPINPGEASGETFGLLRSPIAGHLIWISPELKQRAQLAPMPAALAVGVLDPVVIRAKVHEIEAMQLGVGTRAEITLESLPGRKFSARLTRLPWATASPLPDQPAYFDVEFEAANPDLALREGLTAQLVVEKTR